MLTPAATAWPSPADAERIGAADNDWVEVFNRNGTIACRAVVSHRVPEGTSLMYHAQDRHVNAPLGALRHPRRHRQLGDAHLDQADAPGRRLPQLSWGFNYYGATGPQRDEIVVVRKMKEVAY